MSAEQLKAVVIGDITAHSTASQPEYIIDMAMLLRFSVADSYTSDEDLEKAAYDMFDAVLYELATGQRAGCYRSGSQSCDCDLTEDECNAEQSTNWTSSFCTCQGAQHSNYTLSFELRDEGAFERSLGACIDSEMDWEPWEACQTRSVGAAFQEQALSFEAVDVCQSGEQVNTTLCYHDYPCYNPLSGNCSEALLACAPVGWAYNNSDTVCLAGEEHSCDSCCPTRLLNESEYDDEFESAPITVRRAAIVRVGLYYRDIAVRLHRVVRALEKAGEDLQGMFGYYEEFDFTGEQSEFVTNYTTPNSEFYDTDFNVAVLQDIDGDVRMVDLYSLTGAFVGGAPLFADGFDFECPFECDGFIGDPEGCPCNNKSCANPRRNASKALGLHPCQPTARQHNMYTCAPAQGAPGPGAGGV